MKFIDITYEKKNLYTIPANERVVFFLFNRSGVLTFHLAGRGGEATILSLTLGRAGVTPLSVTQVHQAPDTVSHFIGRAILDGTHQFTYDGKVVIEKRAVRSDASQECRSLLLSPEAKSMARPTLEIKTDDVRCSHAATTSALNPDSILYLATRGLDDEKASQLLIQGFTESLLSPLASQFPSEVASISQSVNEYLVKELKITTL